MRKTLLALAIAAVAITSALAEEPARKDSKEPQMQCCPMDPKAAAALDRVKSLTGTWMTTPAEGKVVDHKVFEFLRQTK